SKCRHTPMKRLRVLILSVYPHGGWHHYSAALCNVLVKHPNIETIQYLMPFREQSKYGVGSEEDDILDPSVRVAYLAPKGQLNAPRKCLVFLRNLVRWLRLVWSGTYDVIHVQAGTNYSLLNLALLLWCKIAGLLVIRTVHEVYFPWREDKAGAIER